MPVQNNRLKTPAKPRKAKTQSSHSGELQRKIEQKAYELYEQRGCVPGFHMDDWLEAERIVLAKYGK